VLNLSLDPYLGYRAPDGQSDNLTYSDDRLLVLNLSLDPYLGYRTPDGQIDN